MFTHLHVHTEYSLLDGMCRIKQLVSRARELARNQTGYHNLIQLTSKAHLEGYYYKPRTDRELLKQHHRGLIALSGCIGGEIPRLILEGRLDEA